MSIPRFLLPCNPNLQVANFASSKVIARPRPTSCLHTPKFSHANTYLSIYKRSYSNKRLLQTTTTHRPSNFDVLPPPRNYDVPDTSIAGTIPQPNDTRPPGNESQMISIPEREAQKTIPVPPFEEAVPTVKQAAPAKPQRKSVLRPRKAAMTLTPSAIAHLKNILSEPSPKLIRVGVKNRGCSGLAYHLEYVEKPGAFDETVEQDGVKVLIDSKALFSIIGSEMDWLEDKLNERFIFRNPNISEYNAAV
ncbi:MAG: Iron-sulfur assembly protein 1 [Vezdaea aestivalis]|nr:MAG: Iron-sulfur assembly protein 1 [Vezdaea aestivalis]